MKTVAGILESWLSFEPGSPTPAAIAQMRERGKTTLK